MKYQKLPINLKGVRNKQREANTINRQTLPGINSENGIVVIPLIVTNGTIIMTDTGEFRSNEPLENYGQSKVLWPGKDAIIVLPQGWGHIDRFDKDGNLIHDATVNAETAKKNWSETPIYYFGLIQNHSQGQDISPSHLFEDIKQTQNIETITMLFKDWVPNKDDISQRFFEIPEISANTYYSISNVSTQYVEGKRNITEIMFQSVNDEFSASGRAVDQYIHRSAPGEGYPRYTIVYDAETDTKKPILNRDFLVDTPVTSYQIEIFGSGILTAIGLIGRRAVSQVENNLDPSYILLSDAFLPANPTYISKKALPITNFYPFVKGHANSRFYNKTLYDKWNTYFDEQKQPNAQGFFAIEQKISELRGTSKLIDRKTGQTIIANDDLLPSGSVDDDDKKPNQPIMSDWTNRTKMWDDKKFTTTIEDINDHDAKMWIGIQPFLKGTKTQYDDSDEYEHLKIYEATGVGNEGKFSMTNHDFINMNFLLYYDMNQLPMDETVVTAFVPGTLPVIGGLFNAIGFGKFPGWQTAKTWGPQKFINGFIPMITAEYWATQINISARTIVPYGVFRNDTSDTSLPIVGTQSQNIVLKLSITDIVEEKESQTPIRNTIDMGQDKQITGKGEPWQYDPIINTTSKSTTSEQNEDIGFIIDTFIMKAVSKSNFRLTFYSGDAPVWQGRYSTESKWDKMDRSWTTAISLSPWQENVTGKQSFNYPLPYVPKNFPKPSTDTLHYQFNPLGNISFGVINTDKTIHTNWDSDDYPIGTTTISGSLTVDLTDNFDRFTHYPVNYSGDPVLLNKSAGKDFFSNLNISFDARSQPYSGGKTEHPPRQTWILPSGSGSDCGPDIPGGFQTGHLYDDNSEWRGSLWPPPSSCNIFGKHAHFKQGVDYCKFNNMRTIPSYTHSFVDTTTDPIKLQYIGEYYYTGDYGQTNPKSIPTYTIDVTIKFIDKINPFDPTTPTNHSSMVIDYEYKFVEPISEWASSPLTYFYRKERQEAPNKWTKSINDFFSKSFIDLILKNLSFTI